MKSLQVILDKYDKSPPIIKGLIQLVPFGIGSAIDVTLTKTIENIQKERAFTFFDELEKSNIVLDETLLKSEDFLHAYFTTTNYAFNTRRREKIKMFAKLLEQSIHLNIDEYEDYLKILDELSYRELFALKIFDYYCNITKRQKDQNDLQWISSFWDKFEQRLSDDLDIDKNQVSDFMNRIARTGCYEMFTGMYLDYTGGKGMLTPTYYKIKEYIQNDMVNKSYRL